MKENESFREKVKEPKKQRGVGDERERRGFKERERNSQRITDVISLYFLKQIFVFFFL